MNGAKIENNVVSFSSFAERAVRKASAGGLQVKARLALAQGEKDAFLEELAGYMSEVLENRSRIVQRIADAMPTSRGQTVRNFRILAGGKNWA